MRVIYAKVGSFDDLDNVDYLIIFKRGILFS